MPKRTMLSVQATPDTANIRTATLFEAEHTIVPCIALVEGVLWPANAPSPELALSEEFGRFPDGWNGRPVTFDHPKLNGQAVSASHPEVMEDVAFGQIFNTTVEDKKLKVEIWINNERVSQMSEEVQEAVERLKAGDELVEVSTGLFTMSEVVNGKFNGEEFDAIWRNIVPDHLAVLPEGIVGACSVEDGCGAPRENKEFVPVMNAAKIEFNNDYHISSDATLTLEGQGCAECQGACGCDTEKKGRFQKLMEMAGNVFAFRDSAENISDNDIRTAIASALSTQENFFWIMAVFDHGDGSGSFVFESFDSGKLLQTNYSISDDGVSIGDERTEVRPVTQFVPVQNSGLETNTTQLQENEVMDKDQLVQELIANEGTQYSEDDRDWLSTLEESQLAKMSPVVNDEADTESAETEEVIEVTDNADSHDEEVMPVSTEDYIAAAPEEVQAVLNSGLRMHANRKKALIDGLLANSRCKFSANQLQAKGIDELETLNQLAGSDVTFEGSAPIVNRESEGDTPPAPMQVFDLAGGAA